jgi:thiamine biosynthesis lipoprotein
MGTLRDLRVLSANEVQLERPVRLDFGGIAKGYAVDIAIETLRRSGIESALVNAGGDLRSLGARAWPVEVRAEVGFRSRAPYLFRRALSTAIASSEAAGPLGEFVRTHRGGRATRWTNCTAVAGDCVTADVLTKWGLQSAGDSPRLRRALRIHKARLWQS